MEAVGFFEKIASAVDPLLDPIFGPLVKSLGPILALVVLTLIITIIILLIHKKFTDQEALKKSKEESKELQKQMKEYRDDPKKVMALQKQMLEKSMVQFKHMWKPLFITFIPIAILYGWLALNVAYYPIMPDTEFTTTMKFDEASNETVTLIAPDGVTILDEATKKVEEKESGFFDRSKGHVKWKLKGEEGTYELKYQLKNLMYNKELEITTDRDYARPTYRVNDGGVMEIKIDNKKVKVLGLHWMLAYIIMALIFNLILRKVFNVH